jgi:hypothetical protein
MKCNYSVTFEFEISQPITVKGKIEATSIRTIAARALDDATEKNKGVRWSSIVLVLERELESSSIGVEETDKEE